MPAKDHIETSTKVYFSYAQPDSAARKILEDHLSTLERQGLILPWHNELILPGDDRVGAIDSNLGNSDLVIFLVSRHFLASNFCWSNDVERAMERHDSGASRIIPIIVEPCDWKSSPFGNLQVLPRNGRAISLWSNPEEAWAEAAADIRKAVVAHRSRRNHSSGLPRTDLRNPSFPRYALSTVALMVLVSALVFLLHRYEILNKAPEPEPDNVHRRDEIQPSEFVGNQNPAIQAEPRSAVEDSSKEQEAIAPAASRPVSGENIDESGHFEFKVKIPPSYKETSFNMTVNGWALKAEMNASGEATVSAPLHLQDDGSLEIKIHFSSVGYFEKTIEVEQSKDVIDLRIREEDITRLPDLKGDKIAFVPPSQGADGEESPETKAEDQTEDELKDPSSIETEYAAESAEDGYEDVNVRYNSDQLTRFEKLKSYTLREYEPPAHEMPAYWIGLIEDQMSYSSDQQGMPTDSKDTWKREESAREAGSTIGRDLGAGNPASSGLEVFESGAIFLDSTLPPNSLQVTREAAYKSEYGLEVSLGGTQNQAFVQTDTPDGESLYRASFMVNTKDAGMLYGQGVVIFASYETLDDTYLPYLGVRIHGDGAQTWGFLDAFDDDGTLFSAPFPISHPLTPTPPDDADDRDESSWHKFEMEWAAADAGEANGYALLLLNDRLVATVTDLKNELSRIRSARLGMLQSLGSSVGYLYLDDYVSLRSSIVYELTEGAEGEVVLSYGLKKREEGRVQEGGGQGSYP